MLSETPVGYNLVFCRLTNLVFYNNNSIYYVPRLFMYDFIYLTLITPMGGRYHSYPYITDEKTETKDGLSN